MVVEIAEWMERHESSLDEMRRHNHVGEVLGKVVVAVYYQGVRRIEARNKKLKIQEQNHQRLQDHLEKLLKIIKLREATMSNLRRPNFGEKLKEMLAAAAALNKTMNVRFPIAIEKMKAIREVRAKHKELSKTFTNEGTKFLSENFRKAASRYCPALHRSRSPMLAPLHSGGGGDHAGGRGGLQAALSKQGSKLETGIRPEGVLAEWTRRDTSAS
eukprot:jgi/Bigna1/68410/fgenesh1_pg.6_\